MGGRGNATCYSGIISGRNGPIPRIILFAEKSSIFREKVVNLRKNPDFLHLCFTQSAMPHRPWEEEPLDPAPEHPVMPTKPTCNDGASHASLNDKVPETESEREEEIGAKKIMHPRHVLKYVVVKRWVTGEWAEMEKIKFEKNLKLKCCI